MCAFSFICDRGCVGNIFLSGWQDEEKRRGENESEMHFTRMQGQIFYSGK